MDLWTTGLDTIRVDMTWTIYWTGGFRITEMVSDVIFALILVCPSVLPSISLSIRPVLLIFCSVLERRLTF